MNTWWVGTVSTLAGAVTAAVLQAWRERTVHRRAMLSRWDETLLTGLVDYLATADRALRALLRSRYERPEEQPEAFEAFEALHEKSQVISMLTGDREHPVRRAARQVREPLLPLRDALIGDATLTDDEVRTLVDQHREARTALLRAAQTHLGVHR